jgi:hypothetical protein
LRLQLNSLHSKLRELVVLFNPPSIESEPFMKKEEELLEEFEQIPLTQWIGEKTGWW